MRVSASSEELFTNSQSKELWLSGGRVRSLCEIGQFESWDCFHQYRKRTAQMVKLSLGKKKDTL